MSTRGIIAWPEKTLGWEGVYHHWDSYPAGLGKALWHSLHGHFAGDVGALLQVLLVEHPGGWSTIVGDGDAACKDWSQAPGYVNFDPDAPPNTRPQCYCHGDRHEPVQSFVSPGSDWGCEWCYVLDAEKRTMTVLEAVTIDGGHAVGLFGSNPGRMGWQERAVLDLDGPEPDWEKMRHG